MHGVIPPQGGDSHHRNCLRVTVTPAQVQWSVFWGKSGEVQCEISDYLKDEAAASSALLHQMHF